MLIADMHCDTIEAIYKDWKSEKSVSLYQNDFHIDIKKLIQGDYILQNFAMFVDQSETTSPYQTCVEMIQCFKKLMRQNECYISQIKTFDDIKRNMRDHKLSAMLTIEEGATIAGDMKNLYEFYEEGVRMMTLTWNYKNEIGYPNADLKNPAHIDTEHGLTDFGFNVIAEMEKLGMIIDVSHGSDALFYDVYHETKKPFVASHSNARSLCGHGRNLTDDMIRKIAERGGVIGVNFYPHFVEEGENPYCSVERLLKHMDYIYQKGGIECLGLGSDFDGIPRENLELCDASYMPLLLDGMRKHGFSSNEIEKIAGGNVLRLYRDCL